MKNELRKKMKLREQIFLSTEDCKEQASIAAAEVFARIEQMPSFISSSTVLVYCSLPGELPTIEFLRKWSNTKRMLVPKVLTGDKSEMELREWQEKHLDCGYKGISEPTDTCASAGPEQVDFAIVPGVAFDRNGGRLGRGKGFYDRLLPRLHCPKLGVCFDWRIVDSVPMDEWDVRMDYVVY